MGVARLCSRSTRSSRRRRSGRCTCWRSSRPRCWSLGAPALRALMPGLVPQEQLAASQALQSIYGQTASIVGPALGGVLIAAAGVGWAYVIDAATFAASLFAVLQVAPAPAVGEVAHQALESLREGWRFLRQPAGDSRAPSRSTRTRWSSGCRRRSSRRSRRTTSTPARGSSACSTPRRRRVRCSRRSPPGWIGHVRRQGVAVAAAIVLWGAAIAGFGFSTALWLGVAMLAVAGFADEISAILRSTILFGSTPDHFRGRMQGFELAQVASTPALGNVEAGVVASPDEPPLLGRLGRSRVRRRRGRRPRRLTDPFPLRRFGTCPRDSPWNKCVTSCPQRSLRAASTRSRPT